MLSDKEKKEILEAYQTGKSSIQTIARSYRVEVDTVLDLIGEGNLSSVTTFGDMVDQNEVGPNTQLKAGETFKVPYTSD